MPNFNPGAVPQRPLAQDMLEHRHKARSAVVLPFSMCFCLAECFLSPTAACKDKTLSGSAGAVTASYWHFLLALRGADGATLSPMPS